MIQQLNPNTLSKIKHAIQKQALPADYLTTVINILLPLAEQIVLHKGNAPLLLSFNGAQGSGKSTLCTFLSLLLEQQYQLNTVVISLDDFYLNQQQRWQRAKAIHPLLKTRGVPGTHDLNLASQTLYNLKHLQKGQSCLLPQFDKASDNPKPESNWLEVKEKVDIILFEGWCNHTPVQSKRQLQQAINPLEAEHDPDGVWRNYVNDQLKRYHQQLFNQADLLIFLQIPSFDKVYQWRGLQEQKLAQKSHATMNQQQLHFFIQHFERLTRQALQYLPEQADFLLSVNTQHKITTLKNML